MKKTTIKYVQCCSSAKGSALVVALFVTALVAAIALGMILQLHTDTRRTLLILHDAQAALYADGSVKWAKSLLATNWEKKENTRAIDRLPQTLKAHTPDGYTIKSTLEDAQTKFNLNNLIDPETRSLFQTLLKQVIPDLPAETIQDITLATIDWITPGIHNSRYDQYYRKQRPPYVAPHQPMASVSEFRLIQHVTPIVFHRMLPFITALPDKTPMNINTTATNLLMLLNPALGAEQAAAFDRVRKNMPFADIATISTQFPMVINGAFAENKNLTITSNYFFVTTEVTIDGQRFTLYTLLVRNEKDKKPVIKTVWQSRGTL